MKNRQKVIPMEEWVKLRGTPIVTDEEGWLEEERMHFHKTEEGIEISCKLEGMLEEEVCHGAEFLASMVVNNPKGISFGLIRNGTIDVLLCSEGKPVARIGSLPKMLEVLLVRHWDEFIGSKILTARKFQVGISLVGREIDKNMMMDGADFVEGMPEDAFNDLMKNIRETFDLTVYVVKIGFFVGVEQETKGILVEATG